MRELVRPSWNRGVGVSGRSQRDGHVVDGSFLGESESESEIKTRREKERERGSDCDDMFGSGGKST